MSMCVFEFRACASEHVCVLSSEPVLAWFLGSPHVNSRSKGKMDMNSITHSQFIGCIVCGSCKGVRCPSPGSKNDVSFCSPQLRSVLTLVSYRTKRIGATEQGWVQKLAGFMDKFYRYGLEEDITCKQAFSRSLSFSPSSLTPPPSPPSQEGSTYCCSD